MSYRLQAIGFVAHDIAKATLSVMTGGPLHVAVHWMFTFTIGWCPI